MRSWSVVLLVFVVGCGATSSTPSRLQTVEHATVEVISSKLGKRQIQNANGKGWRDFDADNCLLIGIRIKPADPTRKVQYQTVSVSYASDPLPYGEDEHGNYYASHGVKGIEAKFQGINGNATVHPGKTHEDLVVLEAPVADASHITLVIPGVYLGVSGEFRLDASPTE